MISIRQLDGSSHAAVEPLCDLVRGVVTVEPLDSHPTAPGDIRRPPMNAAARCALLAAALCIALPAAAQSFRCKADLVTLGEGKAAVLQKCGEPAFKDASCRVPAPGAASEPCVTVEEWVYNPGPGQFMTTLRFEAGELKTIKYGDRAP